MAGHGSRPLRGLESTAQSSVQTAKFGRMFRWLEPAIAPEGPSEEALARKTLTELAALMVTSEFTDNVAQHKFPGDTPDAPIERSEPADENVRIAAGYTYLGQFIDHDITLDTTPLDEQLADPLSIRNFRSPAVDLDSLYGQGPGVNPELYARDPATFGMLPELLVGQAGTSADPQGGNVPGLPNDLPRNRVGRALIGDERNDDPVVVQKVSQGEFSSESWKRAASGVAARAGTGRAHGHTARVWRAAS